MVASTIGVLSIDLVGNIGGFETSMRRAQTSAQRTAGTIDKQLSVSIRNTSAELTRLAGIAGVGFGAAQVIRYADSFTELQNRLRLVTKSQEELKSSTEGVFRIAQATSQSMDSVGQVYQRIAQNADALGLSLQDVEGLTEKVAKAVAISGASAGAAEAGLTQFGQALASGVLRGDEFNSIMEQLPGLAQAIATGLGVPVGALREMAQAGELTAETVVNAMNKAGDSIESAFGTRVKTVAQAIVELQNAALMFFGELNSGTMVSQALATVIGTLANNLDAVAIAAGTFAGLSIARTLNEVMVAAKGAAANTLTLASEEYKQARAAVAAAQAEVQKSVAYGGSIAAATNLAAAEQKLTIATNGLAAAQRGMAVTAGLAGRALALVGGPIGAISIAIGLGVAAWGAFGGASAQAKDETVDSIASMNLSMDELIAKFEDLSKAQQALLITKYRDKILEDNEKIRSSLDGMLTSFTAFAAGANNAAQFQAISSAAKELEELAKNSTLTNDERYDAGQRIIATLQQEAGLTKEQTDNLRKQWDNTSALVDAQRDHQRMVDGLTGSAQAAASAMSALQKEAENAAGVSGKEWDKFVQSLTEARDTAGMTAQQLAEYKAAAMGANEEQQKLVGTIAAQQTAVDDLKKAIVDGDAKAQEGAQKRIDALIQEQAQIVYNIAFAKAYFDLLAMGITATSALQGAQSEASLASLKEFEQLQARVKQTVANIRATTVPKISKSKAGGSSTPKKSDEEKAYEREQKQFKDWIKNQKEKIAFLGTENELEKINAELRLGNWSKLSKAQQEEMKNLAALVDVEERRFDILERAKELGGFNLYRDNALDIEALTLAYQNGQMSLDTYNLALMKIGESDAADRLAQGFGQASDVIMVALGKIRGEFTNLETGAAELFGNLGSDAIDGFADSVGRAIVYSEDFGEAMKDLAKNTLAELISGMVKLGIQYLLFKAIGESMAKDSMANNAAMASSTAAAWAPAAAAVSLATLGANGVPAAAAIIGTNLLSMGFAKAGFAEGGFTGSGNKYDPAGIVHAGEYVFNAQRVREIGLNNLLRLDQMGGFAEGGFVGANQVSGTVASLSSGSSTGEIKIVNQTSARIGSAEQSVSPTGERIVTLKENEQYMAGQLANPNSPLSRALNKNFKTKRQF